MELQYDKCHLWMGELLPHMDDNYLYKLFRGLGKPLAGLRVMRNTLTNDPMHCFLQFKSAKDAQEILYAFDNKPIPDEDGETMFYLDVANEAIKDTRPYFGVWIGNLIDTTKVVDIKKAFTENGLPPIRVMIAKDRLGMSKGYAFIQLNSEWEQKTAIFNMNSYMGLGGSAPLLVRDAKRKRGHNSNFAECFAIKIYFLKIKQYEKEIHAFFQENFSSFRFISTPRYPSKKPRNYSIVKFGTQKDQLKAVDMLNGKQMFGGENYLKVIILPYHYDDQVIASAHFEVFNIGLRHDSRKSNYAVDCGIFSPTDAQNIDYYFDDLYTELVNDSPKARTVTKVGSFDEEMNSAEYNTVTNGGSFSTKDMKKIDQLLNESNMDLKYDFKKRGNAARGETNPAKQADIGNIDTKYCLRTKYAFDVKKETEKKLSEQYDQFGGSIKNKDTELFTKVDLNDVIRKNINQFIPKNLKQDCFENALKVKAEGSKTEDSEVHLAVKKTQDLGVTNATTNINNGSKFLNFMKELKGYVLNSFNIT